MQRHCLYFALLQNTIIISNNYEHAFKESEELRFMRHLLMKLRNVRFCEIY